MNENFFVEITQSVLSDKSAVEFVSTNENGAIVLFQGVTRKNNMGRTVLKLDQQISRSMFNPIDVSFNEILQSTPASSIASNISQYDLVILEALEISVTSSPKRSKVPLNPFWFRRLTNDIPSSIESPATYLDAILPITNLGM